MNGPGKPDHRGPGVAMVPSIGEFAGQGEATPPTQELLEALCNVYLRRLQMEQEADFREFVAEYLAPPFTKPVGSVEVLPPSVGPDAEEVCA
jgi:hypothetical protein